MEYLVCILWIPFVWILFNSYKPSKALVLTFLIGQLFLPIISIKLVEGFIVIYKHTLIGLSLAIIAPLKIPAKILAFRPRLIDMPMLAWCMVPLFTSIANDLGVPDGLSTIVSRTLEWGLPYFFGRIILDDLESIRLVEKYLFVGGLLYVPLCLIEMKFSPQLHNWVYGHHPSDHSFQQSMRMGGYRPTVFMLHGLAVGLWMMAASLAGMTHLIIQNTEYKLSKTFKIYTYVLVVTFFLCKSTGAYVLFILCIACMYIGIKFRSVLLLKVLYAIPVVFIFLRSTRLWLGTEFALLSNSMFGEERAQSLAFRLANENVLTLHAWKRVLFGWGGFGRATAINPETGYTIIFDSLWGVAFAVNGYVGLISITLAIILPLLLTTERYPASSWKIPSNSGIVTILFVSFAYSLDNLFNNLPNQYFLLGIGALTSQAYRIVRYKEELMPGRHENHQTNLSYT